MRYYKLDHLAEVQKRILDENPQALYICGPPGSGRDTAAQYIFGDVTPIYDPGFEEQMAALESGFSIFIVSSRRQISEVVLSVSLYIETELPDFETRKGFAEWLGTGEEELVAKHCQTYGSIQSVKRYLDSSEYTVREILGLDYLQVYEDIIMNMSEFEDIRKLVINITSFLPVIDVYIGIADYCFNSYATGNIADKTYGKKLLLFGQHLYELANDRNFFVLVADIFFLEDRIREKEPIVKNFPHKVLYKSGSRTESQRFLKKKVGKEYYDAQMLSKRLGIACRIREQDGIP